MAFCEDLFIVEVQMDFGHSGEKRSEFTTMDCCMNLTAGFRVYFEFHI